MCLAYAKHANLAFGALIATLSTIGDILVKIGTLASLDATCRGREANTALFIIGSIVAAHAELTSAPGPARMCA